MLLFPALNNCASSASASCAIANSEKSSTVGQFIVSIRDSASATVLFSPCMYLISVVNSLINNNCRVRFGVSQLL